MVVLMVAIAFLCALCASNGCVRDSLFLEHNATLCHAHKHWPRNNHTVESVPECFFSELSDWRRFWTDRYICLPFGLLNVCFSPFVSVSRWLDCARIDRHPFCRKDRKMALLQLGSVDEAVLALMKMHNYQLSDSNHLRVSFSKSNIWTIISRNTVQQHAWIATSPITSFSVYHVQQHNYWRDWAVLTTTGSHIQAHTPTHSTHFLRGDTTSYFLRSVHEQHHTDAQDGSWWHVARWENIYGS